MDKNNEYVPYFMYEESEARSERRFHKLWMTIIILVFLLVTTNICWIIYESQYQYDVTTFEATQDGDSVNIIGSEDVSYGAESEGND